MSAPMNRRCRQWDVVGGREQRPAEQKNKLRAGLTTEREAELLKRLKMPA